MDITVDMILARHGMTWGTDPYRVIDARTGEVVQAGPNFNLTDGVLAQQRNTLDRKWENRFKRPDSYEK